MQKIRKFRAVRRIGQAGVLGAALLLFGGELLSQTAPPEGESSDAPKEAPPAKDAVYLKYIQADWRTILNKVAEQSGSIAIVHEAPEGYHTKHDRTPYTRREAVQRYAKRRNADVSAIGYYYVFGLFKIAIVLQQIYHRYHLGQTKDERFQSFDQIAEILFGLAKTRIADPGL